MVKIKCTSPEIKLGDVSYNADLIINEIKKAQGVDILLLPELCLCGYSLRDMLASPVIVEACQREIVRIANGTADTDTTAFIGMPFAYEDKLYNSVVGIRGGVILGIVPKSSLPKKSPFGENRVFDIPSCEFEIIDAFGTQVGFGTELLFPCADNLRVGAVIGASRENASILKSKGANIILNPTADTVTVTMAQDREYTARTVSYEQDCVFAMCNSSENESTTDALFVPHNLICQNGKILAENKLFESKTGDSVCVIDINSTEKSEKPQRKIWTNNSPHPFILDSEAEMDERCALILDIQAHALARRLSATYSKAMVVGISGGLDSTLALIAMVKSADLLGWDRKNIVAITMPCFGTTKRTKTNATDLCNALGVTLREIDILEATKIHLRDIDHDENVRNVTYENAQARERTQILMDVANDIGGIVVGTGDLSEVALGWATYNGDHMAMYNVNSDIPKTLVRHVVGYFAKNCGGRVAEILFDILDTPVSPELLPPCENGEIEQKTEDIVGPYDLHDYFLYNFAGRGQKPSEIYKNALKAFQGKFDGDTVYRWLQIFLKRFVTQQFKRSASPEGIKIGSVSLSPRGDLNMSSDMSYQAFLDELDANK